MTTNRNTAKSGPLRIDKICFGGKGLGKHSDQKVFFVKNTVPGDVVMGREIKSSKKFDEYALCEVIEQSPLRHQSLCKFSDSCGGCQWQGISSEVQASWKSSFIKDSLMRLGKLDQDQVQEPEFRFHEATKSEGYRRRVRLKLKFLPTRTLVGFFAPDSHRIVEIDHCMVGCSEVNAAIRSLSNFVMGADGLPSSKNTSTFELDLLAVSVMDRTKSGVLATFVGASPGFKVIEEIAKLDGILGCYSETEAEKAPYHVFDDCDGITYLTLPGQFQQAHIDENRMLRRFVANIAEAHDIRTALDLYCGSGNFSLALAAKKIKVTGVEFSRVAIKTAKKAAEVNALQAEFLASDVVRFLQARAAPKAFDLVVLDPPRQGAFDAIKYIGEVAAKVVIYISCDPATFARDAKVLLQSGMRLLQVDGFDLFPHSYHVETVGVFVRI